jgi:hypothetical protein
MGDAFNVVLSAAAMNFHKLVEALWHNFLRSMFALEK